MPSERGSVVVCGAGAAGMAAAIAAARAGAEVHLLEAAESPGGTVANALIHTLGGLYDSAGDIFNDGLAGELIAALTRADATVHRRAMGRTWVLTVCPDTYRDVVRRWIEAEPRLDVRYRTQVSEVEVANGRIVAVTIRGAAGSQKLAPRALVDATGTAQVVRKADPGLVISDPQRAAGGLVLRLRGAAHGALAFPKGARFIRALRQAAGDGSLPHRCRNAWIDTGIAADEVFLKLFVPLAGVEPTVEAANLLRLAATAEGKAIVEFLRRWPEFASAQLSAIGELGIRDGGRVRGEYCLTAADVRAGREFADAACRCAWPIEYWHPAEGLLLEYLPAGVHYEVPLAALRVQGISNLFVAGKCLSADRLAHASARVAGCCWSMGEAVGKVAAS